MQENGWYIHSRVREFPGSLLPGFQNIEQYQKPRTSCLVSGTAGTPQTRGTLLSRDPGIKDSNWISCKGSCLADLVNRYVRFQYLPPD